MCVRLERVALLTVLLAPPLPFLRHSAPPPPPPHSLTTTTTAASSSPLGTLADSQLTADTQLCTPTLRCRTRLASGIGWAAATRSPALSASCPWRCSTASRCGPPACLPSCLLLSLLACLHACKCARPALFGCVAMLLIGRQSGTAPHNITPSHHPALPPLLQPTALHHATRRTFTALLPSPPSPPHLLSFQPRHLSHPSSPIIAKHFPFHPATLASPSALAETGGVLAGCPRHRLPLPGRSLPGQHPGAHGPAQVREAQGVMGRCRAGCFRTAWAGWMGLLRCGALGCGA